MTLCEDDEKIKRGFNVDWGFKKYKFLGIILI